MNGVHFLELCSTSQEAERVREFLQRTSSGASALHTSLRDNAGTAVRVQLSHISGHDVDDRVFHIIGVQEDAESFRRPPEADQGAEIHSGRQAPAPGLVSDAGSFDSESVGRLSQGDDDGELAVYFRPRENGYPMASSSAGFTLLSGPSPPGARLLDWVVNPGPFVTCVHELLKEIRSGGPAPPPRCLHARLAPPHLSRSVKELLVKIEFSVTHNHSIQDHRHWTMKAKLDDIKQLPWPSRKNMSVKHPLKESRGQQMPPATDAPETTWSGTPSRSTVDAALGLDVQLFFKVMEDGYPVERILISPSSQAAPEMSLLQWLVDTEPLVGQCQKLAKEAFFHGDFDSSELSDVRLRPPPPIRKPSEELRARAELSMAHNKDVEDRGQWTVRASLHNLTRVSLRSKAGEAGSSSGGGDAPADNTSRHDRSEVDAAMYGQADDATAGGEGAPTAATSTSSGVAATKGVRSEREEARFDEDLFLCQSFLHSFSLDPQMALDTFVCAATSGRIAKEQVTGAEQAFIGAALDSLSTTAQAYMGGGFQGDRALEKVARVLQVLRGVHLGPDKVQVQDPQG